MDSAAHRAALEAIRRSVAEPECWSEVITHVAAATESQMAELLGWVSPARPPFHLLTDHNLLKGLDDWLELGGADPSVNPLIRTGVQHAPFHTIVDTEVISKDARKRHPLWAGFFEPCNVPHLGAIVLTKDDDQHLTIGVLRTREQGPLEGEARRILEHCAGAAAEAATLAGTLGNEASALLSRGLTAVEASALALDGFGRVVAITERAGAVIEDGRCLSLRQGRVHAQPIALRDLHMAIERTMTRGVSEEVVIRGINGSALRVKLFPLLRRFDLGYNARVLLVLEDVSYEMTLTETERQVLAMLRDGLAINDIARRRGVSRETVRTQTKIIYAKMGVSGQVDLLRKR